MTIPEFLEKLKVTDGPWGLISGGAIRSGAAACPICAVANRPPFTLAWWAVNRKLGLSVHDCRLIVRASDMGDDYDPGLRAQLLAATVNR